MAGVGGAGIGTGAAEGFIFPMVQDFITQYLAVDILDGLPHDIFAAHVIPPPLPVLARAQQVVYDLH